MFKKISGKKFVYFIIGLFTTNIIGSVVIPAHLGLVSTNLSIAYGVLGSKLIMSHTFAVLGIFYRLPWDFTPTLSIPSVNMIFILLILSIISIPITIILSRGIRIYKRIIFVLLIHIEILTLFTWWWVPNFGFS